jgi:hypothetical protein
MDFSKLSVPSASKPPIDPIKIFERLPRLPEAPNDLWRGQAAALEEWHAARTRHDILVGLNTGAGKTVVGLLIAQSLVNEGISNVIYACATIDLVRQTAAEAKKIGLPCTTRIEQRFDNDLFESGRTFCITTYQALFNGLSSIRRRTPPGALICDDAHVAEAMMRDAFTLKIGAEKHAAILREVVDLFAPHFEDLGRAGEFRDAVAPQGPIYQMAFAMPSGVRGAAGRLLEILERNNAANDDDLKWAYPHLKDHLACCAILFAREGCQIAPPFLPSLALDVFDRPIRRVYLSATLTYKTDVVRAFGRSPEIVVEPKNDAGNGERLILFSRKVAGQTFTPGLVKTISARGKVLVAVPSYPAARDWSTVAEPPKVSEFSDKLEEFRRQKSGAFLLVSRVDGIDLPHDTCRIMVLDGLPSGGSLLERFQWEFLNMQNMFSTRLANRIAQLFGRINRGRNDFGAYLVNGRTLNAWLNRDRFVALLPELLQKQVLLGRYVQDTMQITTNDKVLETIAAVLAREPGWIDFYSRYLSENMLETDAVERVTENEQRMIRAALAEAEYARAMWEGDYETARLALEDTIEETGRADSVLAGWHNIWLGACYDAEGDEESAKLNYRRARSGLGNKIAVPLGRHLTSQAGVPETAGPFAVAVDRIAGLTSEDAFRREIGLLRSRLRDLDGASPRQMEEAVRSLGEALGFAATRPDNDNGAGPDVLWVSEASSQCLAFELKTDKNSPATYNKKDVGQAHNSLQWAQDEKPGVTCLGLVFIGPDGQCTDDASPSASMTLVSSSVLAGVRDQLLALLSDTRKVLPIQRPTAIRDACSHERWTLQGMADQIKGRPLTGGHSSEDARPGHRAGKRGV